MPHDYVLKNLTFDPYKPSKSYPQGMTGGHNQIPIQYVIHLSLLSLCAKCGIQIFKIVFVIESCYLPFRPLPTAPGGPSGRIF